MQNISHSNAAQITKAVATSDQAQNESQHESRSASPLNSVNNQTATTSRVAAEQMPITHTGTTSSSLQLVNRPSNERPAATPFPRLQPLDSVIETIGGTPLIKLNSVGSKLKCDLYAKCEFFNPGGSVKDRIALKMIDDAEKKGLIRPGGTLIEATSGNTGIGVAMIGARRGYNVIITMPEKMSQEKQRILELLGAKIIRTRTEAAYDAPESHISIAKELAANTENALYLDQYNNSGNPNAHYEHTGAEILEALDNQVDMVVMGTGTGGTLTGVAQKIKEACPNATIVGADPVGSILAGGTEVGTYHVEGVGYDFIPGVFDTDLVDEWVKTEDKSSFAMAKRLAREEALLCGGSSGAATVAALEAAKDLKPGQKCVVLLADGIRNYINKFANEEWMQQNDLL